MRGNHHDGSTRSSFLDPNSEMLDCVIDAVPDGLVVADSRGRLIRFNRAAESLLGIGLTDAELAHWSHVYGCFKPDGKTLFASEDLPLARALRGETVRAEEILIRNPRRPAGVRILVSSRPLLDGAGRVRGGVALFRDVTEAKRSAETIAHLSSAVEQTGDAVMITDTSGAITFVNAAFEEVTGYAKDEVLGRNPRILKSGRHPRDFYAHLWRTITKGRCFRGTVLNRAKDGRLFWVEQTITPMKSRRGRITHFVSVLKDTTDRRRLEEQDVHLKLAQEVQRRFYVATTRVPGYDIVGRAYPARETGGDYFDFIPSPDGHLTIAVGDVTGHGFGSALLMAQLRASIRLLAAQEPDLGRILALANEALYDDLDQARLITLVLVRLDPSRRRFSYASAGHLPGYVLGPSARVERVMEATGLPLGSFRASAYVSRCDLPLESGSLLALLTDGITEAMAPDEEAFGLERVVGHIHDRVDRPAAEIVESLYAACRAHTGERPPHDDVTLVICRALSKGAPRGGDHEP